MAHHYFSLVVRRGVTQLFMVVGQARFVCLYYGSDIMYQMRRRKPKPTHLPTQGIFNLSHHIDMAYEELAFDGTVYYTQQGNGLQHS